MIELQIIAESRENKIRTIPANMTGRQCTLSNKATTWFCVDCGRNTVSPLSPNGTNKNKNINVYAAHCICLN